MFIKSDCLSQCFCHVFDPELPRAHNQKELVVQLVEHHVLFKWCCTQAMASSAAMAPATTSPGLAVNQMHLGLLMVELSLVAMTLIALVNPYSKKV